MATTSRRLRAGLLEACDSQRLLAFDLWKRQRDLLSSCGAGAADPRLALGRRSGRDDARGLDLSLGRAPSPRPRRDGPAWRDPLRRRRRDERPAGQAPDRGGPLDRGSLSRSRAAGLRGDRRRDPLRPALRREDRGRALPCSSRGGRGWPISCLVMDEAAHFISETDGFQTSDRVFEALAPSTAQFREHARIDSLLDALRDEGPVRRPVPQVRERRACQRCSHHAPTVEVNPTITPEFMATEEARDPEGFRQEYGAEFTGSGDAYLDFSLFEIGPPGEVPARMPALGRRARPILLLGSLRSRRGRPRSVQRPPAESRSGPGLEAPAPEGDELRGGRRASRRRPSRASSTSWSRMKSPAP